MVVFTFARLCLSNLFQTHTNTALLRLHTSSLLNIFQSILKPCFCLSYCSSLFLRPSPLQLADRRSAFATVFALMIATNVMTWTGTVAIPMVASQRLLQTCRAGELRLFSAGSARARTMSLPLVAIPPFDAPGTATAACCRIDGRSALPMACSWSTDCLGMRKKSTTALSITAPVSSACLHKTNMPCLATSTWSAS